MDDILLMTKALFDLNNILIAGIPSCPKSKIYSDIARPYGVKIYSTRKTIAGIRDLEKYALTKGGAYINRVSLDDFFFIKDNHLKNIKDIQERVKKVDIDDKLATEVGEKNLDELSGLIFSQRVLLCLTQAGISRENAYGYVQRNAMKVWEEGTDFLTALKSDKDIISKISAEELDDLFDIQYHTKHVDTIFKRVFGKC